MGLARMTARFFGGGPERTITYLPAAAHADYRALRQSGDEMGAHRLLRERQVTTAFRDEGALNGEAAEAHSLRRRAEELLRSGEREEWNAWQGEVEESIDLSDFDFRVAELPVVNEELLGFRYRWLLRRFGSKTVLGRKALIGWDLSNCMFHGASFSGLFLAGNTLPLWMKANFTGAVAVFDRQTQLWLDGSVLESSRLFFEEAKPDEDDELPSLDLIRCDLRGARLLGDLRETVFVGAHIEKVVFEDAVLQRADFADADLEDARFADCDLTEAKFLFSRIEGTDFSGSTLERTTVKGLSYRRRKLHGKFRSVEASGPEPLRGDPVTVGDLSDQIHYDYLNFGRVEALKRLYEAQKDRKNRGRDDDEIAQRKVAVAGHDRLNRGGTVLGALGGAALSLLAFEFTEVGAHPWRVAGLLGFVLACGLGVGLLSGRWGQRPVNWAWRLLDYGRDWDRVLLLAGTIILVLGFGYQAMSPDHICLEAPGSEAGCLTQVEQQDGAPMQRLFPWYVSVMGFATLGIADIARPLTLWGFALMTANVFAGFVTLGLFLSVVQANFQRRGGRR